MMQGLQEKGIVDHSFYTSDKMCAIASVFSYALLHSALLRIIILSLLPPGPGNRHFKLIHQTGALGIAIDQLIFIKADWRIRKGNAF